MVLLKSGANDQLTQSSSLTSAKKRRVRRKRAQVARTKEKTHTPIEIEQNCVNQISVKKVNIKEKPNNQLGKKKLPQNTMSTVDPGTKSRDEIKAAREAKKLAKQKGKSKGNVGEDNVGDNKSVMKEVSNSDEQTPAKVSSIILKNVIKSKLLKGKDEVDKASIKTDSVIAVESDELKEKIKAERATKKLAKQANKKGLVEPSVDSLTNEMSSMAVSETIAEIVNVAKEVQAVTAKHEELPTKSKAELKAERRAKQEAQRASKQATQSAKTKTDAAKPTAPAEATKPKKEEKLAKTKTLEKQKTKSQLAHRVNWFQHLYNEQYDQSMKKIPVNSSLHPAIIKLGVQLRTRVVSGSNARCIALLDALKKMISDYTLPAKTEFARGLEAQLSPALEHLWGARPPSASQSNAVKFLRRLLTQLPHAVDEFDAKKTLQEEIDSYIRDQIDKAGEAISLAVRDKISSGDNILTYGCSSLIERILCEAWQAGVAFRAVVVGERVHASAAREMLRRLVRAGVPATYVDITALSFIMSTVNKVLLGASALLSNGSVLGALGTAQVALAARAHNVPALVCCETHKFTERVQTDAFVHNELGDPDELIDPSDKNSPLKDWRSNPNLTPLNLTYDVTPPSLVTAVVTELAILPCTSAPVVLRFKLSEYGI